VRLEKPKYIARAKFGIIATLFLATTTLTQPAKAKPKFKVLHKFHWTDGAGPVGALVRDAAGNLYGVTGGGGNHVCTQGCGTAFKLDESGKQVWLHSFNGKNGLGPEAGLLRDSLGNLYGTTMLGGDVNCKEVSLGCGTVFKLNAMGRETLLYKLKGKPDGWAVDSPVARDTKGNLYATTEYGGAYEAGVILKVTPDGDETVLYNFTGDSDGCRPVGVILDAVGNLYGAAELGGSGTFCSGDGLIFKLDTTGNFTVLYRFGGSDGSAPDSILILDADGNLYGTTGYGGSSNICTYGCGTVFELTPSQQENVLYSFCSLSNCEDGQYPGGGPLVRDSNGNLYGTTDLGGAYRNCNQDTCGVVFKLDSAGNETVLHSFTGGADGAFPYAGLVMDDSGYLYGTTWQGGTRTVVSTSSPAVE